MDGDRRRSGSEKATGSLGRLTAACVCFGRGRCLVVPIALRPTKQGAQGRRHVVRLPQRALIDNRVHMQYTSNVPIRTPATFRIDDDLLKGLRAVRERDGVPVSEQVRRALQMWLDSRGIAKAERKRVAARKRP
jgi:hypothetical protein